MILRIYLLRLSLLRWSKPLYLTEKASSYEPKSMVSGQLPLFGLRLIILIDLLIGFIDFSLSSVHARRHEVILASHLTGAISVYPACPLGPDVP